VVERDLETVGCLRVVWAGICNDLFYGVWGLTTERSLMTRLKSSVLGRLESDDGDLWGAVEPEGQAHGADAAVDIELHLVEAVVAFGVLHAHRREDEWSQEWEPDLTAVGVAGEHEIDEGAAWMNADMVGEVGCVRHKENGTVGAGRDGQFEVGVAGAGVVDATEPKAVAISFDWNVLIDQDGGAVGGKGIDDGGGVEGDVMVAEDAVAKGSGEGCEDLGASVQSVISRDEGEGAVCDEVAGKEYKVGV